MDFTLNPTVMLHTADDKQLHLIFANAPKWLYIHKPMWVVFHHPDWVAQFDPKNMMDIHPHYMVQHRIEWVAFNAPEKLFLMDLPALRNMNPKWLVENQPYHTAYVNEKLSVEYDPISFMIVRTERADNPPVISRWLRLWYGIRAALSMSFQMGKTDFVAVPDEYLTEFSEP